MKIRLSSIFLLAFAVLLVGCHKLEATTVVNPDGSGELKMGVGFSAEERENLEKQNNTSQDFCNTAQSAENITVVEEQRGEETWCITTTSFKDLEELRSLYEQRKGIRINRLEIVDGTFYFDMDIDTVSETSDFAVPTEITWSMVLPGTPIEHNADEVLETTLTWAVDPESENVNLRAESEAPQRGFNFPPCGSAFIGLTAALVFLRRRFKNQVRVFAVDLKRDRTFDLFVIQPLGGFLRAAKDFLHFHELGVTHRRPQRAAYRAEGPVRVAVHGREDRIPIDGDVSHKEVGSPGFAHKRPQV